MASDPASTFSLLTYNINDECVSDRCPDDWSMAMQHAKFRELILKHRPELLCLQECFSLPDKLKDEYDFHGAGVRSHRGSCCIATRKGSALQVVGEAFAAGPCIVVPLRLGERSFHAACAHLAPFAESAPKRARQVACIAAAVPDDQPFLLAGDMNMRESETPVAGENGLVDAWIEAGSPPEQRWTWDTRVNQYYHGGRQYTARYDRILSRGCRVSELAITANAPCSDVRNHFLSDHFGIAANVQLC